MRVLARIVNVAKKLSKKQLIVVGVFTLALSASVGLGLAVNSKTLAWDCGGNAIDTCGAPNAADYVSDLRRNSTGDLQNIARAFGLAPNEYDDFAARARQGATYKNGNTVVDGQVVLTNSWSIGRWKKARSLPVTVPGSGATYWANYNSEPGFFGSDAIPVMVYFNGDGSVKYTAMNDCGNNVVGAQVVSHYGCRSLSKTAVPGQANTYDFRTDAFADTNASISRLEYNFGDGTKVVKAPGEVARHTFTTPATYNIKVTVFVRVPGGNEIPITAVNCTQTVSVAAPMAVCTALNKTILDEKNRKYKFTVSGEAKNGATIKDANFIYDGHRINNVALANTHAFNDYTSHKIVAEINFLIDGKVVTKTSPDCAVTLPAVPIPYAACDALKATVINDKKRSYSFTLTGVAKNGAVIKSGTITYDGVKVSGIKPDSKGNMVNAHVFNDYKAHKIVGEVVFDINGTGAVRTSANCAVTIPATNEPYASCDLLKATVVDATKRTYKFTLTGTAKNGAKIKSGSFSYDGTSVSGVLPVNGVMTDTHTFTDKTGHKIIAKITFDINGTEVVKTSAGCEVAIPALGTPACTVPGKENLPVDSPDCRETCTVPGKTNLPKDSPDCYESCTVPGKTDLPKNSPDCKKNEVVTTLPNTGPGEVFGIFAGTSGIGAVAHRLLTRRRRS